MIQNATSATPVAHSRHSDVVTDEVREYCLTILHGMNWPGDAGGETLRTLGITSCESGEGVTTVAGQLAAVAASCGDHPTLLVEANLAHPSSARTFEVEPAPGLAEVVLEGLDPAEAVQASYIPNLSVLPAGNARREAAKVYDAPCLPDIVAALREAFPLVIFDLPAIGRTSAAIRLGGLMDGVLLVVEAERVAWDVAQRAGEQLRRGNARLVGAVLNKSQRHIPAWLHRWL